MKQEGTSVSERVLNVLKLKLSQIFTSRYLHFYDFYSTEEQQCFSCSICFHSFYHLTCLASCCSVSFVSQRSALVCLLVLQDPI